MADAAAVQAIVRNLLSQQLPEPKIRVRNPRNTPPARKLTEEQETQLKLAIEAMRAEGYTLEGVTDG